MDLDVVAYADHDTMGFFIPPKWQQRRMHDSYFERLWARLREWDRDHDSRVVTIPHHPAEEMYPFDFASVDYDDDMAPLVEVYSQWGSSERQDDDRNPFPIEMGQGGVGGSNLGAKRLSYNSGLFPDAVRSNMRALIFDLDGTLLQLDRSYESILSTAFEAASGRVENRWLETYGEAFADVFAAQEPDPARIAFEATDAPGDPTTFATHLHEAEIAASTLPEHAHSDLKGLTDRFSLGILTNGPDDWQRAKLDAQDLRGIFDAVVTSYEAGGHKPDPAPYHAVESKLNADAYAMIGDSDSDIDGADSVGWQSVRYTGQRFETIPDRLPWDE